MDKIVKINNNNTKLKQVLRVEQHRVKRNDEIYPIIDHLCLKSKNLYNYGNYIVRQSFIETSKQKEDGLIESAKWIRYSELYQICKDSEAYLEIYASAGQQVLKKLDLAWKSFFASIKDYGKNPSKYKCRPKMPQYLPKEDGRYEFILTNQRFKIKNGYIYTGFKGLSVINNRFRTNIPDNSKLMQLRFVPRKREYIMEVVYEISVPDTETSSSERIASITFDVNNLMTVTTNCGAGPLIVNGKPLKSINQYYNKEIARRQSKLKKLRGMSWSNEMQRFTTKRNNKVNDYVHKATKLVIDFCKENNIDTIVCGFTSNWKNDNDVDKTSNQEFNYIPYSSIILKLEYKCENAGIIFKNKDDSYAKGTSFLDNEDVIKENYNKSRKVQGLFISNSGKIINADVNSSYQVMVKTFPDAFNKDKNFDREKAKIQPEIIAPQR